jgi:hypothetical protein
MPLTPTWKSHGSINISIEYLLHIVMDNLTFAHLFKTLQVSRADKMNTSGEEDARRLMASIQ